MALSALALIAVGIAVAATTGDSPGPVSQQAPRVVVLELFTSQGCSSCPPADRLLSRLARDGAGEAVTIIPLAYHVDYWNHLGWQDPFSSAQWSERQRQYTRAMKSLQVYTPQMVIDGATEVVGSNERKVRSAIASRAEKRPAATVTIRRVEVHGRSLEVDVEVSGNPAGENDVQLAAFESGLATAVRAGENGGSQLRDDFVVRTLQTAELKRGARQMPSHFSVPLDASWSGPMGVAAFVQNRKTMVIEGAAAASVPRR